VLCGLWGPGHPLRAEGVNAGLWARGFGSSPCRFEEGTVPAEQSPVGKRPPSLRWESCFLS